MRRTVAVLLAASGCALADPGSLLCDAGACPTGLVCLSDGLCHPAGAAGSSTGRTAGASSSAGGSSTGGGSTGGSTTGGTAGGSSAGGGSTGCNDVPTTLFPGRAHFGLTADGQGLFVVGGEPACTSFDEIIVDTSVPASATTVQKWLAPFITVAEPYVGTAVLLEPREVVSPTATHPGMWLFGGYANGHTESFVDEEDPYEQQISPFYCASLANGRAYTAAATEKVVKAFLDGGILDSVFVIAGGAWLPPFNGSSVTGAVELYDAKGSSTTCQYEQLSCTGDTRPLPDLPTPRSYLGGALGPDGHFYAIGGQDGTGVPLATVEALNLSPQCLDSEVGPQFLTDGGPAVGCGWDGSAPPPQLQYARTDLAVTADLNGTLYAIGGVLPDGGVSGIVETYAPGSGAGWTQIAPLNLSRHGHGAVTTDAGLVWVVGGFGADGGLLGSLEYYAPGGDAGWQLVPGG